MEKVNGLAAVVMQERRAGGEEGWCRTTERRMKLEIRSLGDGGASWCWKARMTHI
jgi:hypothetical protein